MILSGLVAEMLHCEREHVQPLAQLVQEKTGGNPFFAIQFLAELNEAGLVAFDRDAPVGRGIRSGFGLRTTPIMWPIFWWER